MALRTRAQEAFETALRCAGAHPELERLRTLLIDAHAHLDEPMRVAIVGHIKAGKSTMLNALLGEELAPTGAEELTFNVNWLRWAPTPSMVVHFKDGRDPEQHTMAELEELTSRREENRELLQAIRYIEVLYPNEILRTFDLIDTPGLRSAFSVDSLNTISFLGLSAEKVEAVTREESGRADAVLCLFNRSLHSADEKVVAEFRGPLLGHATPINAIGVLTKVDAYWNPIEDPDGDPLKLGRRVADSIMAEPHADRVFYAVRPVCGLLAFGARTLTEAELTALRELAGMPAARLASRLLDAERFANKQYPDVPLAPEVRGPLVTRRLGQYGIWLAVRLLRENPEIDLATLREELFTRSGVASLQELIVSHFGRRALLIKTQTGLRKGLDEAFTSGQRLDGEARDAAKAAGGRLSELERGEGAFREFALLRDYYNDRQALGLRNGEAEELLRVTGEHGTSIGPRLGLPEGADADDMVRAAEQRRDHWEAKYAEFGASAQRMATARAMTGAYTRILYHAREARRHLELDA